MMDILGWLSRLGKSKGLDIFNKLWMLLTLIMVALMLIGNYFKLGKEHNGTVQKPVETSTPKTGTTENP